MEVILDVSFEYEFEGGQVYEVEVPEERDFGHLERLSYYVLKGGPETYKTVNIWEISQASENPYIVDFWHMEEIKDGLLTTTEEKEFKCQREEVDALLGLLDKFDEVTDLEVGNHMIISKNSPESESLVTALEAMGDLEEGSQQIFRALLDNLKDKSSQLDNLDFDEELQENAIRAESVIKHARMKTTLEDFKDKISEEEGESDFQTFLEDNTWLFGNEYVSKVENRNLTRDEEVDFCLQSVDQYFDVIDIKRPDHTVLNYDSSHDSYYPTSELNKAVAQVENYLKHIDSERPEILSRDGIDLMKPRGVIVIGKELSQDKREYLRIMNSHLNRIRVLTYSDLVRFGERTIELYDN